jgi:Mg-chelatase subunit ChlD
MNDSSSSLRPEDRQAMLRWRLVLGPGAEQVDPRFSLDGLAAEAAAAGSDRLTDLDRALDFVYGERGAGSGGSRPYIPTWLANLREFFSQSAVAVIQKDAIERKGLVQLLFEPETLPFLEKNVNLVATLVSARGMIPDRAKSIAREVVREVVDDLRKRLESRVRSAVIGALHRQRTSPLRIARNIDWRRTIRNNLKGWNPERQRLLAERFYFWSNQRRHHEWDIAIVVDQSGSMATSVVYSSVMAAIFASIEVVRTRLLFFDTNVVDMTPVLNDPVEVLFTAQLGGGTDINRAVAYAQQNFIEKPDRTLFVLITDLFEGGNKEDLKARIRQLVDARVKVLCLLALSDTGRPSYDHALAADLSALGVPCFGCTPDRLVEIVERIMKNQEIGNLAADQKAH